MNASAPKPGGSSTAITRKRPLQSSISEAPESKSKKAHPFFSPQARSTLSVGRGVPSPPTLYHYINGDPFSGISNGSSSSRKIPITFYDLDGTLIKTQKGGKWPKDREDWAWWNVCVPRRLKDEVAQGRHVIVISNQGGSGIKQRDEWKAKIPLIAAKLPDVSLRVLAAFAKDIYRKPNIGMFQVVQQLYKEHGLEIDMDQSVYVGDAAGRQADKRKMVLKDHSDTDYKWALNVGLRFLTPEEHFLSHPRPVFPEPPNGFLPSRLASLATLPPIVPSNTPITRPEVEIVLFVGPPASGKTSFYRRHFEPAGYEHINQDTLGTRDRCMTRAELLINSGKKVVVDNTNRNSATRAYWVQLADRLHVPIRLFHFLCPVELARHNNMYRATYGPADEPKREVLPGMAFSTYTGNFEAPTAVEGFDEIKSVNFVWEGTDEQRRYWDMYMLE